MHTGSELPQLPHAVALHGGSGGGAWVDLHKKRDTAHLPQSSSQPPQPPQRLEFTAAPPPRHKKDFAAAPPPKQSDIPSLWTDDEDDDEDTSKPHKRPSTLAMTHRTSKKNIGTGICARIAVHRCFDNATMTVIVLNALWIGIDTEWNHASKKKNGKLPLEPWSIIVENMFCFYFTCELVIRFLAFRVKRWCIWDAWFVFDSVLVVCMVAETWLMPIIGLFAGGGSDGSALSALSPFRLLRLLRLTRMARLMRFVPEMMTLVKGILAAARSVGFIFLFLVLVMYVFAIVFTDQLGDRVKYPRTPYCSWETSHGLPNSPDCLADGQFGDLAADYFATLGDSMMTLLTRGVLGDNLAETVQAILNESVFLMWVWWVFVMITFATLVNMLIGVLCEVVRSSADAEAEALAEKELTGSLQDAIDEVDEDNDGYLTETEWDQIKTHPLVVEQFESIFEQEDAEESIDRLGVLLFGDHDDDGGEVVRAYSSPGELSLRSSGSDNEGHHHHEGLALQSVIRYLIGMRPNQDANILDLELTHAVFVRDQDYVTKKLRHIQAGLQKVRCQRAFSPNNSTLGRSPHKLHTI